MRAICRTAVHLMAMLLVSATLVALPCKPASAGTGDNYPAVWKNQPLGATYDTWGLATRYCTSWAAWALHNRNSFELPFHDDAKNWGSRASTLGYAVNMTPAKGSIAWWANGDLGHVAYVESVSSDGLTVTISEYNNPAGSGAYNLRTISKTAVSGYIHFKDIVEELL